MPFICSTRLTGIWINPILQKQKLLPPPSKENKVKMGKNLFVQSEQQERKIKKQNSYEFPQIFGGCEIICSLVSA